MTDFDEGGGYNHSAYIQRLEWLHANAALTVFPAGGAGEFFSLTPDEYQKIVKATVEVFGGATVFAGAGGSRRPSVSNCSGLDIAHSG